MAKSYKDNCSCCIIKEILFMSFVIWCYLEALEQWFVSLCRRLTISQHYLAGSRRCILKEMLCDGWNQCGDWEDEYCKCSPSEFECFLQCVTATEKCQGTLNCGYDLLSWSDELDKCDCKKCKN